MQLKSLSIRGAAALVALGLMLLGIEAGWSQSGPVRGNLDEYVPGEVIVDTGAVGFEQAQSLAVEVLHDPVGGPGESEHARQTVVLEGSLRVCTARSFLLDVAEHLGHAALHHAQEVVHLKAPILGAGIA